MNNKLITLFMFFSLLAVPCAIFTMEIDDVADVRLDEQQALNDEIIDNDFDNFDDFDWSAYLDMPEGDITVIEYEDEDKEMPDMTVIETEEMMSDDDMDE